MEIIGSFIDQDWESLSQIFANDENPDFLLHCNGSTLFSSNLQIPPASYFHFDQAFSANFSCSSHESSNEIDEALFLNVQDHEDQQQLLDSANDHTTFESFISNDGFMLPVCNPHDVMEEFLHLKDENRVMETDDSGQEMRLKRKPETPFFQIHEDESHESEDFSTQNPKKKQRISRNAHKSRATQKKKSKKTIQDRISEEEEEGINGEGNSSEDDSNASHLMNASNPKTRASRGSATDPQSLYARKRRERINERLKILQNLVPNGTKVDISTMLEEAVQYVKFLQLQIKLLISDNLWMYAPLAYNGMDISIYQNISPNLRP